MPLGIVGQCHSECQRLGDRCRGFVVHYTNFQTCFWLDSASGDDRDSLSPEGSVVYFEKICLRERTCRRLWAFERVLGHDMQMAPIKEIPEVARRTDCEDLCLQDTNPCRSATYHYGIRLCRLFDESRRSRPSAFQKTTEEVDYLENHCSSEPPTCQYKDYIDRMLPYIDRMGHAMSLHDCQRQCDAEQQFICRSISYETFARDCALSSEDTITTPQGEGNLQLRRNSVYSEKGTCEEVSVQCNQQDMLLTINFGSPFNGRVYAKGNPSQCFVVGTGQTTLQFAISMGSLCGTRQEGADRYANEVVVQQHPVIMTDNDKTIRVLCSFDAGERTYTLGAPLVGGRSGMEVSTRTLLPLTALVTNTAAPPSVNMRVLDGSGRDARAVGLGEELTLRIELEEPSSAFAIAARNLYARSSNGESLFLIDSSGCPTDKAIFPALQVDPRDKKSLQSSFKAFRFPSTGMVNFEVQIRFCQDECEPVRCPGVREVYRNRRDAESSSHNETSPHQEDEHEMKSDAVVHDKPEPVLVPESVAQGNQNPSIEPPGGRFHSQMQDNRTRSQQFSVEASMMQGGYRPHAFSPPAPSRMDPSNSHQPLTNFSVGNNSHASGKTLDPHHPSHQQMGPTVHNSRWQEFPRYPETRGLFPSAPSRPHRPMEIPHGADPRHRISHYPPNMPQPPNFHRPVEIPNGDRRWGNEAKPPDHLRISDSSRPQELPNERRQEQPHATFNSQHAPSHSQFPQGGHVPSSHPQRGHPNPQHLQGTHPQGDHSQGVISQHQQGGHSQDRLQQHPQGTHQFSPQGGNQQHPQGTHQFPPQGGNPQHLYPRPQQIGRHGPPQQNRPQELPQDGSSWHQNGRPPNYGRPPHTSQQRPDSVPSAAPPRWQKHQQTVLSHRVPPLRGKPDEKQGGGGSKKSNLPKDVPLSLAIQVGEDDNNPPKWNNNRYTRREGPDESPSDTVCSSQSTIIAIAVTVTVIYIGSGVGTVFGYRWYKNKRKKRSMPRSVPPSYPPVTPAEGNVTYGTPDVTFRSVYGNFGSPP